jgi:hypothetical protein
MLFYQAIDSNTLELLRKLMSIETFAKLRLVGGASLAMQIGHRQSIDIDLFGLLEADEFEISEALRTTGFTRLLKRTNNISIFLIDNIKVDLVNYPYPWIEEAIYEDNIRLAGLQDIAAMKLSAVAGRGTKKDFIDIFFLLKKFSLSDMLGYYNSKFHDASDMLVLKSLTYFEDAEAEEEPRMLYPLDWEEVKKEIASVVRNYLT